MEITIRLLASYRRYLPEGHDVLTGYSHDVATDACVSDVLDELPIPTSEAFTFFVNGRHAGRDQVLQAGDILAVFPAAGGG
jgi:molybdopterin converting factor small subunit